MSSIGTGYDLSCMTFSPDGRIFQVEYAMKAVELGGTSIGIRCKDGVVLGVENIHLSKLLTPGANRRLANIDRHVGISSAGLLADSRAVVARARYEAQQYRDFSGQPVPGKVLAARTAMYMQAYTLYSSVRPFGASVIIAAYDRSGPQLFMIEPSGVHYGFHGCAIGKGKQAAKTEIEKLKFSELTVEETVNHVVRILHMAHDESKDKLYDFEVSWICKQSNFQHQRVPAELLAEADRLAMNELNPPDEME